VLDHAISEYHSQSQPLGDRLSGGLVNSINVLERMITALEQYQAISAPKMADLEPSAGATTTASSAETKPAGAVTGGGDSVETKPVENGAAAAAESAKAENGQTAGSEVEQAQVGTANRA
jgi:hypothetical protein